MKKNEIKILENKTLLAAFYYLEEDEVSQSEHENIKSRLSKSISKKDIAVYGKYNTKERGEMLPDINITDEFLNTVRVEKQRPFSTKDYFYNGLFYTDNEGDFVVVTRELKNDFNHQMFTLLRILIVVFVLGVALIFLFSQILGKLAYQPIISIMNQIGRRNTKNFHEPIVISDTYSEIRSLTQVYNRFVENLGQTFHIQKNFIDYVSHELKTPITALMGNLEVSGQKERSPEEYKAVIEKSKKYVGDLEDTIDKMMLLSGAKTDYEFRKLRLDEIVWDVVSELMNIHQTEINVRIDVEIPDLLTCEGNRELLELAISNIIENAVKYSNKKPVDVRLYESDNRLAIDISDQGIGIPEEELENITQNFYRGSNTEQFQGKGIGLSLAHIILSLHNMTLNIQSSRQGTTVTVFG